MTPFLLKKQTCLQKRPVTPTGAISFKNEGLHYLPPISSFLRASRSRFFEKSEKNAQETPILQ